MIKSGVEDRTAGLASESKVSKAIANWKIEQRGFSNEITLALQVIVATGTLRSP